MQHEQAAGGTAVGGDDRGLHPELIRRAGLALADALGLGGMEGIQFLYLPFEHSESLPDQERCSALFAPAGDADLLQWAELHADIIRRFGRFPHRNAVLGRASTPEETQFLSEGKAGHGR